MSSPVSSWASEGVASTASSVAPAAQLRAPSKETATFSTSDLISSSASTPMFQTPTTPMRAIHVTAGGMASMAVPQAGASGSNSSSVALPMSPPRTNALAAGGTGGGGIITTPSGEIISASPGAGTGGMLSPTSSAGMLSPVSAASANNTGRGGDGGSGIEGDSAAGAGSALLMPPNPHSQQLFQQDKLQVSAGGGAVGGGAGGGFSSWLPPMRRTTDSEDRNEASTPRGSSVGTKRTRREGVRREALDPSGQRTIMVQLTPEEQGGFMDRIRDLYDSKQFCDVTLRVEGQEFRAHKAVLACSRSFLGAMMASGMREESQDTIVLKDIGAREFKILLDYIYSKPIYVPSCQVVDLLGLATRYQVEGLKNQMCNALSTYLDHDNACAVFAAADSYQCVELKDQAFDKIVQHFALAARSEGWSALTKEQLAQVVSSDLVLDCDESVVFDAAARWLQAEPDTRRDCAPEVLGMVRFPLMDAGLLSDVIKNHEVTQTAECQALIAEAWEHHALKAVGRDGLTGTPRAKKRRRSCSFKKHTLLLEHSDAVSALAVIKDKLVSGSWDTNIKVWDPQSWTSERTLSDHTGTVRCFAACADRLLSGSDDGSIKVWNPETWSLVRTLDDHGDAVNAVIECAGRLASGSDDGTIKLWNTDTWQCEVTIHQADHTCGVLALATCGDFLVSGSDGGIKVWNTHNWMCHKEVLGHGDEIWALTVVGDKLVSGSIDSTIRVWDPVTWKCERLLSDHIGPVYALTVLEGKLVSASSDHTIRVWGPDWQCNRVLQCSGVWSLNVFNNRLVSGSLDNAVKVWGA